MPRKKVLYVITKADTGGAQKYVADLAAGLDSTRFEAKILYGGRDPSTHSTSSGQASSGQSLRWLSNRTSPWLFFTNDWLAVFELVRAFRRERPDVIHLNSSKAGVVGSLAAGLYKWSLVMSHTSLVKVIFTAHGWVFNPANHHSPFVRWGYRTLHRFAARFQDVIINVSEYDRALALATHIAPPEKLVTIHNGINPNIPFLPREAARKEILKRIAPSLVMSHQSLVTAPWVGSLGRLTKEKDYGTLIAAAALVPNSYFFVIGSGPEFKKLQVISHTLSVSGRFFVVPPAGDDATLLKAFDIFALSSIKEGLPYTLLEAMAAGLPVVVSDAGGMPEAIAQSSCGAVVPKRNPERLAEALAALAADPEKRTICGRASEERVRRAFTLRAVTEATASHYGTSELRSNSSR